MKKILVFVTAFLVASCNHMFTSDSTKAFIPGVYVGTINTEFSKGTDSLFISAFDRVNTYRIIRKAGYRRNVDGKTLPAEYKMENWTAVYDEKDQLLKETAKGKVFSFDPERKLLLLGSAEYHKIN